MTSRYASLMAMLTPAQQGELGCVQDVLSENPLYLEHINEERIQGLPSEQACDAEGAHAKPE